MAVAQLVLVRCMAPTSKSRRNSFLVSAALIILGIVELVDARYGYKAHRLIPGLDGSFITPTQGYVVACVALAFGAYVFARALRKNDNV